jgi:DNA-binding transcriptional MocR family regulator
MPRSWAGVVDPPVSARDPFAGPTVLAAGDERVTFEIAECGGDLLPRAIVERAMAAVIEQGGAYGYAPVGGALPAFLEAAQAYLRMRGVEIARGALLVTSGTTSSLAMIVRALVPRGGTVLVEHPTWHVALAVFAAADVRVVGVPVDDEGLRVDALGSLLRQRRPPLLYLQPAFQNPTGVSLGPARRAEVVRLARRAGAVVVEDDFAAEFAYGDIPPPLRMADAADDVVYVKSFSKLAVPALRLALVVAPTRYERVLRDAQHGLDPFPSAFAQAVLAHCLSAPAFWQHTRRVAARLEARWAVLDGALQTRMPEGVHWTSPRGGLCAWLEVPPPLTALEVLLDVAERGVGFTPGSAFCLDGSGERGARVAFGATPPPAIERGVRVLASSVRDRLSDQTRTPRAGITTAP